MAYAYDCPQCDRCWPYTKPYGTCPVCRVTCRTTTTNQPMTQERAKYELKAIEFNAFYAQREARRGGPSPEELGRREARTLIELDKGLPDWSEVGGEG